MTRGPAGSAARLPLYARIADAVALVIVVLAIGGSAAGLTRWQDARALRVEVETRIVGRAQGLAADVATLGPEAAVARLGPAASVHVLRTGTVDDFGIAQPVTMVVKRVDDPLADPGTPELFERELQELNGKLEERHEKGGKLESKDVFSSKDVSEAVDDASIVIGVAPVVKDGAYFGLVRVSERVVAPTPSVPTSTLLIGLLLAALLGFGVSFVKKPAPISDTDAPPPGKKSRWAGLRPTHERLAFAGAAAAAVAFIMLGQSLGLALWSILFAAVFGLLGGPGLAAVARGVREKPGVYLYIFPAMIGMIVLVFVPFIMGVALAFFTETGSTGLSNFEEILVPEATVHPTFYWTTGFTIMWTISNVVLHVTIGVALALVLNRESLKFKGLYRVLLVVPWAVPNYITALIWRSMFNPQFGAVNGFLDVLGLERVDWLGAGSSFWSNYIAALTTNTWLGFPFMMVVTLGALQSIPKDLYEAADIDGASRFQKFKRVTLPLLKPALVPAIILGVIWTFNMFNVIYLVSGGAPDNETNILVTEAYRAFRLDRFELAAAYSLLIFVMLLLYGWMQNRVTRATEGAFE